MSKRSHAIDTWDFIVIDDITGIKKLRSECEIDGYGFLSNVGDPRNPQEIPAIIHEDMAAWPDPRPQTATQYVPGNTIVYFLPAYAVLSYVGGVSTTFTGAPTICYNAPLATIIWSVDGEVAGDGIIATLLMDEGLHSITMHLFDELGNEGFYTFEYTQPPDLTFAILDNDSLPILDNFGAPILDNFAP